MSKWSTIKSNTGHIVFFVCIIVALLLSSCSGGDHEEILLAEDGEHDTYWVSAEDLYATIQAQFGDRLSLSSPFKYEDQQVPDYIEEDNTANNPILNEVATLGRVLFYDKSLSVNRTVSCASCHQQAVAFSDRSVVSQGVNGVTGRHSMRLINARFGEEERFFWDERATTLEAQTTQPIQDHVEMGFSGTGDDPDMDDLLVRLASIDYLVALFEYAYGDAEITEARMQTALAQFIRSIQSFDSRFDEGMSQVNDPRDPFPNYSVLENEGKSLFMGRAGCDRCHQAPVFSINDNSNNNGVITVANDPDAIDTDVTRAPTLRDLFNAAGELNGPMMHDGSFATLEAVLAHYNRIENTVANDNLDNRLTMRGGQGQNLNLRQDEINAIVAFVKTLSGTNVYTDERWSDPFED